MSCSAAPKTMGGRRKRGGAYEVPTPADMGPVPEVGARRRKSRKGKKSRKGTRRMRGGVMYGFNGAVGTNGADYGGVPNDAYDSATGRNLGPDPGAPAGTGTSSVLGGRRHRKSRRSFKGKKKSRKMKGGSWNPNAVNVSGTGVGYSSGGSSWASGSGYPIMSGYSTRLGGAPMGADGVRSA